MPALRRSSLVQLYPGRWRRRYGDEFRALLDDEPLSRALVMDVLAGALGAHLTYPLEEPIMSTRQLHKAAPFLALVALVPASFALAAVAAKEFLAEQSVSLGGAAMGDLERGISVAAGAGAALVLGALAVGWRFRTNPGLRGDLAASGRLLRRLALTAVVFAVLFAVAVAIVVPVLLTVSHHR